ncbi:hypothetical protein [Mastigocladopsis repens]|uniref:hypothetical protein n=1 Tax=Mastigocladopsis repens TaxID=221287 RepID=UPI00030834D1|nr:hypothetical protein [Mastigocladopsis repens]
MMTQVKSAIAAQDDKQAIAKSDFEQQFLEKRNTAVKSLVDNSISFQMLADATETILLHAFWLAKQKQQRSLKEYRKLLAAQGWKGEEKRYLKVAAAFQKFSPQELAQIEPSTVYQLAENSKKYKQVIDRLLDLTAITQEAVRSLIKEQRVPKELKLEKPSIWRRTKNGGRYCQVPPIHETDDRTGTTLQKMMDEEGLSAQKIVAEAVALRQAYKEGQLAFVEKKAT